MKRSSPSASLLESLQQQCICQISQVLFKQPVMTVDGHTYQKSHIIEWLNKNNTSPKTGLVLESNKVYLNYALKNLIEKIYQEVPRKERNYQERIEELKENIKDKDKNIERVNNKLNIVLDAVRSFIKDTKFVDFVIQDHYEQFSILNQFITQFQQQQAIKMSLQFSQSQQQKPLTQQFLVIHKQNMFMQKLLNLKKNIIETSSILHDDIMVDRLIKMLEKEKKIEKDSKSINKITQDNDNNIQDYGLDKLQNISKRRVRQMDLLFKASEFQFNIRDYVQICGQAEDSVILIKTQHDKIVGGYSHKAFNPTRQLYDQKQIPLQFTLQQVADQSSTSFLFSLTHDDYFQLIKPNCSIIRSFGSLTPIIIFGNRQLFLLDYSDKLGIGCNKNMNENYFNQNYQKKDKDCYQRFHGGMDQYFKIKQWEVWKVDYYTEEKGEKKGIRMGKEDEANIRMIGNEKMNKYKQEQIDNNKQKKQSSLVSEQKQQKIVIELDQQKQKKSQIFVDQKKRQNENTTKENDIIYYQLFIYIDSIFVIN